MEDERRLIIDLDELRQLLLLLLDVDVRVPGVAEDAEVAVDTHVEAGRLHQRLVVRLHVDPLLGVTATATLGARFVIDDDGAAVARPEQQPAKKVAAKPVPVKQPRALPDEVRGIHVTMALASLDGKLQEYLKLVDEGMNTIQLDVKDENGEIGFIPSAVPLASKVGAARQYYRPREAARLIHRKGVYLIGRV